MSGIKRLKARDEEFEEAVAFSVAKPLGDLPGLAEQIKEAHGWRKDVALTVEGDLAAASPENPAVLWVLRADADANAVRRAVTAHQEVESSAPQDDELTRLRLKAADGEDLTADEMQSALRLLLTRGT